MHPSGNKYEKGIVGIEYLESDSNEDSLTYDFGFVVFVDGTLQRDSATWMASASLRQPWRMLRFGLRHCGCAMTVVRAE